METTTTSMIAPLITPLPSPPAKSYYSEQQWTTLMAIMDTVIPSIKRASATTDSNISSDPIPDENFNIAFDELKRTITNPPSEETLTEYLAEKPSDNPEFHELVNRMLMDYSREDARKGFSVLLSALK